MRANQPRNGAYIRSSFLANSSKKFSKEFDCANIKGPLPLTPNTVGLPCCQPLKKKTDLYKVFLFYVLFIQSFKRTVLKFKNNRFNETHFRIVGDKSAVF